MEKIKLSYLQICRNFSFSLFCILPRSLQREEPIEKQQEVTDFQHGQFQLSEHHRLMLEACQFAQFKREHPLEKWTVGSLPNLSKSFFQKHYPTHWEIWTVKFNLWTLHWKLKCYLGIVNFELWACSWRTVKILVNCNDRLRRTFSHDIPEYVC